MRQENKDHLRRSFALVLAAFSEHRTKNGIVEIPAHEAAEHCFLLSFGTLLETLLEHENEEFDEGLLNTLTFDNTLERMPKEMVKAMEKVMGKKIIKSTFVPKNEKDN